MWSSPTQSSAKFTVSTAKFPNFVSVTDRSENFEVVIFPSPNLVFVTAPTKTLDHLANMRISSAKVWFLPSAKSSNCIVKLCISLVFTESVPKFVEFIVASAYEF